jgi:periplasmic protein TonB
MTAQALIQPVEGRAEIKRWAIAAAFVTVMHTGLIAGYLLLGSNEPEGSADTPAVMIDLSQISTAPPGRDDFDPGQETVETPQMQEPPPQAKPEVAEPIEKAEAPSEVTLPLPEPKAEAKQQEEPTKEKLKTETERVQQPSPPRPATAPRSGERVAATQQAALPGAATANREATRRWQHLIGIRLQQHKRYPDNAEGRQGTVMLRFQVARDGTVLSKGIVRSSGVPALDQAVLAMLQRAQPLPKFLPGMTDSQITLTQSVEFAR